MRPCSAWLGTRGHGGEHALVRWASVVCVPLCFHSLRQNKMCGSERDYIAS